MDSSAVGKVGQPKRQRRSIAEKRRIVELAMQPGASVARVAREHGVNANMVHYWRSQYRQGRLGENRTDSVRLLPVSVSEPTASPAAGPVTRPSSSSALVPTTGAGVIYLEFAKVHLRIESGVDAELVRVVLETLQR